MKKQILAAALAAALCLAAGPALAEGPEEKFPAVNTYPGFLDVAEGAWYADAARVCCEVGLMQGTDAGFEPEKVLTVGEVAAIAARMNAAITGEPIPMATPRPGESLPWYFSYVAYLEDRLGIDVPDPAKQATRLEFVSLLSAVLPEDMLSPINAVTALPDTDDAAALRFYNAGILTGVDAWGTFAPDKTLTRAECAAMAARAARSGLRLPFVPADYSPFTAAYMQPGTVVFDNGVTAKTFLPAVNAAIARYESALGEEFNWHADAGGKSVLDAVKEEALSALGVTAGQGADAYRDFDFQVYYSRLIDLTGGPLGRE